MLEPSALEKTNYIDDMTSYLTPRLEDDYLPNASLPSHFSTDLPEARQHLEYGVTDLHPYPMIESREQTQKEPLSFLREFSVRNYTKINIIKNMLADAKSNLQKALSKYDDELTRESEIAVFADRVYKLVPFIDMSDNFQDMLFAVISVIETNFSKILSRYQIDALIKIIEVFRANPNLTEEQITDNIEKLEESQLYITG